MDKETRVFQFQDLEVRQATEDEPPVIRGYAAVYDEEVDLGWTREVVRRGAFDKAISRDDVRALYNHDANYVLGRNTVKTLSLTDDDNGLRVQIVPPDTQWANDLITSMERGDVDQMSFAFSVDEEIMTQEAEEKPLRELRDVTLYDVSVVTYPAYPQTSANVQARSLAMLETETDGDVLETTIRNSSVLNILGDLDMKIRLGHLDDVGEFGLLVSNDDDEYLLITEEQIRRWKITDTDGDDGQAPIVESDETLEADQGQARRAAARQRQLELLKLRGK